MGWHWSDVFIVGIVWGFLMWFMTLINLETHRPEWNWIPIVGIILFIGCIIAKIKFKEKKKEIVIDAKLVGVEVVDEQKSTDEPKDGTEGTFDGVLRESDLDDNFKRLSWQNAEDLVGKLFEKKGYFVKVTERVGDFGIDVEAKKDHEYLGIQVKHLSTGVGVEDVLKTLGASNKFSRMIIVATKNGFTNNAVEFAEKEENRYRIELWDRNRFKQELRQSVLGK